MRLLIAVAIATGAAAADSSAILDDLQRRAFAALDSIPRAVSRVEVERQRGPLKRKLEDSLRLGRGSERDFPAAFLNLPTTASEPAPAIIIVSPHEDPSSAEARIFAASLARLGFIVVSLNLRSDHDRMDLLLAGITPQSLFQSEIRAALSYLLSRPDVDTGRIGLVGVGLAATIGAAINSEVSALVVADGAPDLKTQISSFRSLRGEDLPDSCELIPGIVQYAAAQELFAMIAPRPVLAIHPDQAVFAYAKDRYRAFGSGAKLQQRPEAGSGAAVRYAAYNWLSFWLQHHDLGSFSESEAQVRTVVLQLSRPAAEVLSRKQPFSAEMLPSLLGTPLPSGAMGHVLNECPLPEQVTQETQPGIQIPSTVYRPGALGCVGKGWLIALDDEGRDALSPDPILQEAVRRGWALWVVDPRGIGELKVANEGFVFATSLLLGENFVWRQAADISRILGDLPKDNQPKGLYARGKTAGLIAAYVAAIAQGDLPTWIALRDTIFSFSNANGLPRHFLAFDAYSAFDIRDLLTVAKPKIFVITDPEEFMRADW